MTATGDDKKDPATKKEEQPTELDYLLGENKERADAENSNEEHTFFGTIAEGAEMFVENAQELASDFVEAVQEETHDVQETFRDEMEAKDHGDSIFYEMTLTRQLSILPSDLQDAATQQKEEAETDDDTKPVLPTTEKSEEPETIPFHAYVTLMSAVIALSSIGPSLDMQQEVAPVMKIFWRMTGTWMFLLPFALRYTIKQGLPDLNNSQICTFLFAASSYAVMAVGFVVALEFTSVGNAVIFANSQAVLLLTGKIVEGSPVQFLEAVGALVAFVGAIFCCVDGSASTNGPSEEGGKSPLWSVWGDLLALVAGLGGCFYLV